MKWPSGELPLDIPVCGIKGENCISTGGPDPSLAALLLVVAIIGFTAYVIWYVLNHTFWDHPRITLPALKSGSGSKLYLCSFFTERRVVS